VNTTLAFPVGALFAAVRVVLCATPGARESDAGLAVTPVGNPLNATLAVPVKPFSAVAVTWTACPVAPVVRLSDCGLMASEKSGCAGGGGAATVTIRGAV